MVYVGLIIGILVLYFATINYRREERSKMFSESKFKNFCGIGMFFVDSFIRFRKVCGKTRQNSSSDEKLKKLYVKDRVKEEQYVYIVEKTCISIVIFAGIIFVACGYEFGKADTTEQKEIFSLNRANDSYKEYDLEVRNTNELSKIRVRVDERLFKEKQIYKKFEKEFDDVVKQMLGNNTSVNEVKEKLVFEEKYKDISLEWLSSNSELIDNSGEVKRTDKTEVVNVYLTMTSHKVSKDFVIEIVLPKKNDYTTEELVQQYIDLQSAYSKTIKLPESIDGKNVSFSYAKNNEADIPFLLIAIIISIVVFIVKDKDIDKELKLRSAQLETDYSEIITKLMLLNNAGLSVRMSWRRIISDYDRRSMSNAKKRYAYEEMKLCENKMQSGSSEFEAYEEFGKRCGLHCYIKLGSILQQSVTKGSKGTRLLLEGEVSEALNNRKNIARRKGEEAGTKMLFPMLVMLVVSIVIIVVPSFLSMGMM